jgi:hypothetical protein
MPKATKHRIDPAQRRSENSPVWWRRKVMTHHSPGASVSWFSPVWALRRKKEARGREEKKEREENVSSK